MYKAKITPLPSHNALHYRLLMAGKELTFAEYIELSLSSISFVDFLFRDVLYDAPYEAYFWEVKPITENDLDTPFEFVLIESKALASMPENGKPFAEHFLHQTEEVVSFPNLGGDAQLIVPRPVFEPEIYAHLNLFIREAPYNQIRNFWRKVAFEFKQALGPEPRWLSTNGLGVIWVHVRIDSRPKYYNYSPYRQYPGHD